MPRPLRRDFPERIPGQRVQQQQPSQHDDLSLVDAPLGLLVGSLLGVLSLLVPLACVVLDPASSTTPLESSALRPIAATPAAAAESPRNRAPGTPAQDR